MSGCLCNPPPAIFSPVNVGIPLGAVGTVLTVTSAGALGFAPASGGGGPQVAHVAIDENNAVSGAPANDANLIFTALAAGFYALQLAVSYWITNSSNFNYTVNTVGTVSERFVQATGGTDGSTTANLQSFQCGTTVIAPPTTNLGSITLSAMIAFTSAGNTIAFAWSPAAAGATAHVRGGSWAMLTKVG
jgi:hypothetical protein